MPSSIINRINKLKKKQPELPAWLQAEREELIKIGPTVHNKKTTPEIQERIKKYNAECKKIGATLSMRIEGEI